MLRWKQSSGSISTTTIRVFSPRALAAKAYPTSTSSSPRPFTTPRVLLHSASRTVSLGYNFSERCPTGLIILVTEEYQYATTSAYSPTLSEMMPLKGKSKNPCLFFLIYTKLYHALTLAPFSRAIATYRVAFEQGNRMALEHIARRVRDHTAPHITTRAGSQNFPPTLLPAQHVRGERGFLRPR